MAEPYITPTVGGTDTKSGTAQSTANSQNASGPRGPQGAKPGGLLSTPTDKAAYYAGQGMTSNVSGNYDSPGFTGIPPGDLINPTARTDPNAPKDYTDSAVMPPSVQEQLTGLLAQDSPYMQQAETGALQQSNERGLLNSSLAVEAAEGARIAAALPIAQQDAGFGQNTSLQNDQLLTTIGLSDASSELKNELAGMIDSYSASKLKDSTGKGDSSVESVRKEYDNSFDKFFEDPGNRSNWRTDNTTPSKQSTAKDMGLTMKSGVWGKKYTDKDISKASKINKLYGNWANAKRAVEQFYGYKEPAYSASDIREAALALGS